jgi:hypothetical protein
MNVRSNASASFKVSGEGVSQRIRGMLPNTFYASKREPGVFIQKASNRIGTAGEKVEITQKGILANRLKRKALWGG